MKKNMDKYGFKDISIEGLEKAYDLYDIQRKNCTTRKAQDSYTKILCEISYWKGRKTQEEVEYSWKNG